MTPAQKKKCNLIIHSAALSSGMLNLIPAPGAGIAADMLAMSAMTISLASVFEGSLSEEVAKGMAIVALKEAAFNQPTKILSKELSKFIPGLGQIVAPTISIVILEAAGWAIAKELEKKFSNQQLLIDADSHLHKTIYLKNS